MRVVLGEARPHPVQRLAGSRDAEDRFQFPGMVGTDAQLGLRTIGWGPAVAEG